MAPRRLWGPRFVIAVLVVPLLVIASLASEVVLGWGPYASAACAPRARARGGRVRARTKERQEYGRGGVSVPSRDGSGRRVRRKPLRTRAEASTLCALSNGGRALYSHGCSSGGSTSGWIVVRIRRGSVPPSAFGATSGGANQSPCGRVGPTAEGSAGGPLGADGPRNDQIGPLA